MKQTVVCYLKLPVEDVKREEGRYSVREQASGTGSSAFVRRLAGVRAAGSRTNTAGENKWEKHILAMCG